MLQDFADQLSAQGLSASSVRNTILPAAGDLPARPPPRRRRRQPHPQARAPRRPRRARPGRRPNRGRRRSSTPSSPPTARSTRPPSTPASALGELQALHWDDIDLDAQPDPRHAKLGPPDRLRRAEKPLRQPPRPDHRTPSAANSSTTASTKAQAANGFVFPNQATATSPSTPAPSNSTPARPGRPPASPRSASTNAATATPPT